MKSQIICVLFLVFSLTFCNTVPFVVEHRISTAESWKNIATITATFNPENSRYKLDDLSENHDSSSDIKKKLDVFFCWNLCYQKEACAIQDVYSIRLIQGNRIVASTSVSAVFSYCCERIKVWCFGWKYERKTWNNKRWKGCNYGS